MEVWKRGRVGLVLLLTVLAGCQKVAPVESLPGVRRTLDEVGVRLGQVKSERELTAVATRQAALLSLLKPAERLALGRNAVRFRTDAPVMVAVASLRGASPFWLEDQGFRPTGFSLHTEDGEWVVHHKTYPRGWVGLGVNGLDRTTTTHYAAFVRSAPGQAPLDIDKLDLVQDDGAGWTKRIAHQGVSASSGLNRPFRELPKELDGAILLQPAHDRRHAALLAGGRVWKTHSVSRDIPDQAVVSFGLDPARELVWSWRTSARVDRSAIRIVPAKYETAESDPTTNPDLHGMRTVEGDSRLVRSDGLVNDPLIRRHSVTVGGLEPDTMFYYSLGDGDAGRWGPWRTVKTGPSQPRRLEFLYLGDAQTGLEQWGKRLNAAFRRHPGMDGILLAGDLVDRGNERTNWDHFFLRAEPIFDRVPVMPAVGNHEYLDQGPRLYNAFFRLPQNGPEGVAPGLVYHFQYGGALFAVLDSTLAVMSPSQARKQAEWLDKLLAESTAEWKFVMFHHTVYPSHPVRDNPVIREHWVPIFDKHHVDMVLQGHDHAYLRTYPMKANQRVSTSAEGTTYVVAVSGDKFAVQGDRDYIEVGFTELSTYQTIEIDEIARRLTYRAWTDDGEAVDSLVIDKPARDANRPLVVRPPSIKTR
ncbi:MAG: metallophosphoesterase family protein [Paludisphaera borealis]|uniref:metallophosphoesterase family protein n=1 Tax=Paludisphaera borealis TaxID=1387353 RepID=UPI00283F2974|nr:metallophosphoesterase family protein [Paludisphaera borealis]MDR3620180.1 metallophosphoesterase family protein [Paludisphaera borealis]